ncbi:MAG TPA: hypothetical protein VJY12_00045, partial [Dysgonamonadaceae bacterium]|nr:hypothetical protein [Dysgonamonadaceae bacterium]
MQQGLVYGDLMLQKCKTVLIDGFFILQKHKQVLNSGFFLLHRYKPVRFGSIHCYKSANEYSLMVSSSYKST